MGGVVIAAAAFSVAADPVEAAIEAGLAAQVRSGAERTDPCVVVGTATAHRAAHALSHAVRRVIGAHAVVDYGAVGVLTEAKELTS